MTMTASNAATHGLWRLSGRDGSGPARPRILPPFLPASSLPLALPPPRRNPDAGAEPVSALRRAARRPSAALAAVLLLALTVVVAPPPAPAQSSGPTGVTATAGAGRVTLSWGSPNDIIAARWQVRHTSRASGWQGASWADISGSGAGTTSHTVTGLSNGTAYRFQVRAVNADGNGAASGEATATPMAASGGGGGTPDDGPSGALARADRGNAAVLAAIGSQALGAVTGRIEAAAAGGAAGGALRLGALPAARTAEGPDGLRPLEQPGPSLSEVLDGAAFTLPLGASATGGEGALPAPVAVWGRGGRVSFSGSEDSDSWDGGGLWSAHLGADMRLGRDLVAGASVSRSEGEFDAGTGDGTKSVYEAELTSVHPYAAWLPAEGLSLWASAGYGRGEMRVEEEDARSRSQDLTVASAALGGRGMLVEDPELFAGGMTWLALKGEGSLARAETDAGDGLAALSVDTHRLRLALEGSHERALEDSATLTPALEAGLRHDGGDAAEGSGVEAGASLTWRDPGARLTAEARTRLLAAHEADRDEWGVSARVRLDPGIDGRGTFLTLAPSRGGTESGLWRLFDRAPGSAPASARTTSRLDAEVGHGIGLGGTFLPRSLLTPYAGLSLVEEGDRAVRLGMRYHLGDELRLGVKATSRPGAAEDSLMLRGALRW